MARKLYLIKRISEIWYDETAALVIRALDVDECRQIAAESAGDEGSETWLDPLQSSVIPITNSGKSEIILTDYRAG